MGRLIYAEGGVHPRRRWQRHLKDYCPSLLEHQEVFLGQDSCPVGQEYALLGRGIQQQILHREQVIYLIRSVISEVLFDLTQQGKVTYKLRPDKYFMIPIVAINPEQIIALVGKQWQAWQDARLGDRSPNSAPIIKSLEALEKRTSAITFRCLCQRLNGKNTLRDLAIDLNQDLLRLTQSLMVYVQWGLVDLIAIPDLPDIHQLSSSQEQKKSVVYILPEGENAQRLGKVLAPQGYDLLTVQGDSLEAIALCLDKKPAAILLSAQLSPLDGYEICYQLRQVALFRHKPIFVITEQKSIKDKIRAKMVGASDVLDKSALLYSTVFLLNKHLEDSK